MVSKKLVSVFLYTTSFILVFSCSKNEDNSIDNPNTSSNATDANLTEQKLYNKEYIRTAPLDEQLNYRSFHLTQLANEVVSSNINYKSSFSKKADKNGSFGRVFFRDLIYSAAMDSKDGTVDENVQYSLDAFDGLAEDTTMPYMEQIKEGEEDSMDPIFLLSTFDTEMDREIVIGFRVNAEHELEQIESEILEEDIFGTDSEKDPMTNTIYKIGDTDACGNYYKTLCGGTDITGGVGGTTDVNVQSNQPRSLKIEKMKIKDKKESWLEKADVYITGGFMSSSVNYFEEAVDIWYPNNQYPENRYRIPELFLSKYSSNDVKNGSFKTLGKHLMYDYGSVESSTFFSYIIYEWDGWPAQVKRVKFDRPGGSSAIISYQSYNDYYIKDQVRAEKNFTPEPEFHVLRGFGNKRNNSTIEYYFTPSN